MRLLDRGEQRGRGIGGLPRTPHLVGVGRGRRPRREPPAEVIAYRLGDDVVHPSFGDGVVTGLEPGGIVVIRFSRDRSERKLVADLAPITRR